jgi:hypothetical protein
MPVIPACRRPKQEEHELLRPTWTTGEFEILSQKSNKQRTKIKQQQQKKTRYNWRTAIKVAACVRPSFIHGLFVKHPLTRHESLNVPEDSGDLKVSAMFSYSCSNWRRMRVKKANQ